LLVAFCFGAFIEGCAGLGRLWRSRCVHDGLDQAVSSGALNLIANTAPVAWGAIALRCTRCERDCAVGKRSERDDRRILPITAVIVPFWLVRRCQLVRNVEVLPAILVVGAPSPQRNGSGPITWTAICGHSCRSGIAAGDDAFLARVQRSTSGDLRRTRGRRGESGAEGMVKKYTAANRQGVAAFAILSVLVLMWGLPSVKLAMIKQRRQHLKSRCPTANRGRPAGWDWPYLQTKCSNGACCAKATPEGARFDSIG